MSLNNANIQKFFEKRKFLFKNLINMFNKNNKQNIHNYGKFY